VRGLVGTSAAGWIPKFLAGLIPNLSGEGRDYPFFKFGRVSSIPEEDTLMPCGNGTMRPHTVRYLAATLIGGNSGSPIFILPPGHHLISVGNTRPFLAGLQLVSLIAGEIAGMTPSQYIFEILASLHLPEANMFRGSAPTVKPLAK
jgi:hypothetical protein